MRKVITYGTYDLLHYGHIRLLERAKALGDYLIVGVTADSFDKVRGKINVTQSLSERIEGVRATGIADEIIVEEYEGQKIDDIKRLGVDVFTVGSDWRGHFDYLSEYCEVIYLERTQGISSTEIRSDRAPVSLGFIGSSCEMIKHPAEVAFINGMTVSSIFDPYGGDMSSLESYKCVSSYDELLGSSDAVFVISKPVDHYHHVKRALESDKHVICESPIAFSAEECNELFDLADSKGLVLAEALKTAYATAYHRLQLLVKSGRIGRVVSVEATCTSMQDIDDESVPFSQKWGSADAWAPTALLPLLQLLGNQENSSSMLRIDLENHPGFDAYGRIDLIYGGAIGTAVFGKAVKSEGSLVVAGTKGYVFVPAPWWKTDYFEIRRENQTDNRRFYYQLDGEGIRNELASFARAIQTGRGYSFIEKETSVSIARLMGEFIDCKPQLDSI